jgi:hypothetical protein
MVYTPIKGTSTGGHFYMYETMHLTELSWSYDNSVDGDGLLRSKFATNAIHPDLACFAARMMLALPYIVHERGTNTF